MHGVPRPQPPGDTHPHPATKRERACHCANNDAGAEICTTTGITAQQDPCPPGDNDKQTGKVWAYTHLGPVVPNTHKQGKAAHDVRTLHTHMRLQLLLCWHLAVSEDTAAVSTRHTPPHATDPVRMSTHTSTSTNHTHTHRSMQARIVGLHTLCIACTSPCMVATPCSHGAAGAAGAAQTVL